MHCSKRPKTKAPLFALGNLLFPWLCWVLQKVRQRLHHHWPPDTISTGTGSCTTEEHADCKPPSSSLYTPRFHPHHIHDAIQYLWTSATSNAVLPMPLRQSLSPRHEQHRPSWVLPLSAVHRCCPPTGIRGQHFAPVCVNAYLSCLLVAAFPTECGHEQSCYCINNATPRSRRSRTWVWWSVKPKIQ